MSTSVNTISQKEYFVQEEFTIERHEYIAGEIRTIKAESILHSSIGVNVMCILHLALKGKPYYLAHAQQRLSIPQYCVYLYPDLLVASKPLVMQDGREDTILNACLVVEVLSPSTKNYDRSEKFHYYRSIPEFQEYILVEQDRIFVEHYIRTEAKKWSLTEYTEIDDVLKLALADCEITLADIYEDIEI